jgi:VWFA-related protein
VAEKRRLVATMLSLCWAFSHGPAANGSPPSATRHVETETVKLVLVPTTVLDGRGRPVKGLAAEDFRILDEGTPREIELFATEADSPTAIAFVLDVSGSMAQRDRLEKSKQAIAAFVHALGPGDRFALIAFADEQVAWITDFTADRERFLERLAVQEAFGETALYDALAAAPRLVDEEIDGRKAIVLLTDGIENASRLPVQRAVQIARQVRVPIYSLFHIPYAEEILPSRVRRAANLLGRFSEETGGTLYLVHEDEDLTEAIGRVQDELGHQYLLGFRASDLGGRSGFRRLDVQTRSKRHDVRSRSGYYP